ncbi:MAG: hypothetical protein U9N62_06795 [Thermotogota bacterium]|nr:hypothetical protein [Thermotogota bacterium]
MKNKMISKKLLCVLIIMIGALSIHAASYGWGIEPFDDFNNDNTFNYGMQNAQTFFINAGADALSYQNMFPIADFLEVMKSDTLDLAKYSDTVMGNIGEGDAKFNIFGRGLASFGLNITPTYTIGGYIDLKADSGFTIPNWIMEIVFKGNQLTQYPTYEEKGPVLDAMISAGGVLGMKTDWGMVSVGIGAYGPAMYATLDRYAEVHATPTAAGTVSLDAKVYSAVDLDFANFNLQELDYGGLLKGIKTDIGVVIGRYNPICGIAVRDIPITSAQLNYEANLLDIEASFTSDPVNFSTNTNIPDKIVFDKMSEPVEYRAKPTISGFFNLPFSDTLSMVLHANTSGLSGTYIGGTLSTKLGMNLLVSADITGSFNGAMMYSAGLGFHSGFYKLKINAGVGTIKPFDFKTIGSPRLSVSTSLFF